jgi:hypothetical protein
MKRGVCIVALALVVSLILCGTVSAGSLLEPNGIKPSSLPFGTDMHATIASFQAYLKAGYPVNGVKGAQLATYIEAKGPVPTSISLSPMPSRFNSDEGFSQSGYTNTLSIFHPILIKPTPSNATVTIANTNIELIGTTGTASSYAVAVQALGGWFFYAKKPCKVKLTVTTDNGKSASKTITISQRVIPISSMSIYTKSTTDANYVKKSVRTEYLPRDGQSHELKIAAVTSPSNASFGGITQIGETISTTGAVVFKSSNNSVAQAFNTEPSKNGFQYILMKKPGTVTISAKATDGGSAKATMKLKVKGIPVVSMSIDEECSLSPGITRRLIPVFNPVTAWDKSVVWTSSNKSVATVDQNGFVTAHKRGYARITCKLKNGQAKDWVDLYINNALQPESIFHVVLLYGSNNTSFTENIDLMREVYDHDSEYFDQHVQNLAPTRQNILSFCRAQPAARRARTWMTSQSSTIPA